MTRIRLAPASVEASRRSQAAHNNAVTTRNKDELTPGYPLETPDGTVLIVAAAKGAR